MEPFYTDIPTLKVFNAINDPSNVGKQLVMLGTIEGVPPTSYAGIFGRNCVLQRTDATGSYSNTGTTAVPVWTLIGTAATGITALTGDVTGTGPGSTATTIAAGAVTTSKIAANAVDGTKIALASQAAGDIMYYDGTDWIRLAKGTAGQVLTMNGGATAPIWA